MIGLAFFARFVWVLAASLEVEAEVKEAEVVAVAWSPSLMMNGMVPFEEGAASFQPALELPSLKMEREAEAAAAWHLPSLKMNVTKPFAEGEIAVAEVAAASSLAAVDKGPVTACCPSWTMNETEP